ncbi:AAA_5 ATPase [Rhodopseudomonas palustris HaA2]|uniref:AAA_5 ATPase n=1 Tax=Rhodopseudomonas palustris (strain HaA2) TaxID=316058 RepID=Q2IZR0_RHOP2|nr:AAA family ATPase [Rhodopseudomonas palustris]ABD06300.1 AAA_5 ATPase [Rhodopseudomonas palustris HaA2]
MRAEDFKAWLEAGGALTEGGRNTRANAVATIERNLAALGSPNADLEEAWNSDRFEHLRRRLKELREELAAGGTQYHVLMPQSENPEKRLSSWRAWLGQYGRFLSGEIREHRDADRIRRHVLENYIEPARERDEETVDVLVRRVNDVLGLNEAWPNICQALQGKKFRELADLEAPEQIGADQSPATIFRFHLDETFRADDNLNYARLFVLYDAEGAAFEPVKNRNRETNRLAYRIKPRGSGNEARDAVEVDTLQQVARAMLVDHLAARVKSTRGGAANYAVYGKEKIVRYELDPSIALEIGVPPNGEIGQSNDPSSNQAPQLPSDKEDGLLEQPHATNLILYGPPGTGKTFTTALEALKLCGEPVPDSREHLMEAYRRLSDAGRIEFVTFHQSISYEDFVEGLRPTQSGEDGAAGFGLKPEQGVFRRIARRAETSTGPGDASFSINGRQVFKMSIGEAANPDDAHLFEEAVAGAYTLLGFEDIDWSDDRFATRDAIIQAVRAIQSKDQDEPSAMSGRVQMPFIFRNWVRIGDIVVVSKGNSSFRAIGEITGEYQFAPREGGDYAHRRAVRWLWVDRTGVPVSEIYARNFTQKSIYLLTEADLNVPALERYIASQQGTGGGAPESFVLIIDEINRANISKVFGELITLLEPDKRIGRPNALKVRLPYSGDLFGVPANLHIIGTMNTADRSIALLDTALRRRFEFRELMPDPSLLGIVDGVDLSRLLATINQRIEYLFDREHQIGHAYFISCKSRADIDEVMRCKVIPLLAEYFYEDWSKVAAALGDGDDSEVDLEGHFIDRQRLKPPKGISSDGDGAVRYRWTIRRAFSYSEFSAG